MTKEQIQLLNLCLDQVNRSTGLVVIDRGWIRLSLAFAAFAWVIALSVALLAR